MINLLDSRENYKNLGLQVGADGPHLLLQRVDFPFERLIFILLDPLVLADALRVRDSEQESSVFIAFLHKAALFSPPAYSSQGPQFLKSLENHCKFLRIISRNRSIKDLFEGIFHNCDQQLQHGDTNKDAMEDKHDILYDSVVISVEISENSTVCEDKHYTE